MNLHRACSMRSDITTVVRQPSEGPGPQAPRYVSPETKSRDLVLAVPAEEGAVVLGAFGETAERDEPRAIFHDDRAAAAQTAPKPLLGLPRLERELGVSVVNHLKYFHFAELN